MDLLTVTSSALEPESLTSLRKRVAQATEPDRAHGRNPYHYTFWYDLAASPRNVVEQVVRDELRAHLPETGGAEPVGVEWWLGRLTAPYGTDFEFGVHRDFGAYRDTGVLANPRYSSILYLTTLEDGPLVVFRDLPNLRSADYECAFPRENTFVVFPGDRWHAVLDREELLGAPASPPETGLRLTVVVNWWLQRLSTEVTEPMKLIAGEYDGTIHPELRA
jgi:hypothetical protein